MKPMRKSAVVRGLKPAAVAISILALAGLTAPAAPVENAALFYWKAIALMQEPASAEESALQHFVDSFLSRCPPKVFAADPEGLRWILEERAMLTSVDRGARQSSCSFPIAIAGEAALDLSHLVRLNALTDRALAAAKAYEYADNAEGAAIIYADLLRLAAHLDQDRNVDSGLMAANILQTTAVELEGFFAREQSEKTLMDLVRFFRQAPARVFHPGDYIRAEARRYGNWLMASPEFAEVRLNQLYGKQRNKPAVEQLVTLDKVRKIERLKAWVDEYRSRMDAIAEAVDMPFEAGLPLLREYDAQRAAMAADPAGGGNPLIPLLVPEMAETYQRFLLAEAQVDVLDILCAAATVRAQTSGWPTTMDEVTYLSNRDFANDPFTGAAFHYRMKEGQPAVTIRAPKWMASDSRYAYTWELAIRRDKDDDLLSRTIRQIQRRRSAVQNSAVPMR